MARARHLPLLLSFALLTGFSWEGRAAHVRASLASDDPAVRLEAAQQIGELSSEDAAPLVVAALADEALEVRLAAADAAGRTRAHEAIPALAARLAHADERERAAALAAIARIDHPSGTPTLLRALLDPSSAVRIAVLDRIDARGELVPAVATCLDDPDSSVRIAAARALGRGRDGRALFSLTAKLSDDVPLVRLAVVRALTDLRDPEAASALVGMASDPDPAVRTAAVYAVGVIGGEEGAAALHEILEGGTPETQRAALLALGEIGGKAAAPTFARHLRHESLRGPAREGAKRLARTDAARLALGRAILAEAERASSTRELEDLGAALVEIVREAPLEALGVAIARVADTSPLPTPALLSALAGSGADEALLPLLLALERSSAERSAALEALERFFERKGPDARALEPILDVLPSLSDVDERRAIALLGAIGDPRVAPLLLSRLAARDAELRLVATRGLDTLDDPKVEDALLGLLDDPDARVREEAARAIGHLPRANAVERLTALLSRAAPTDRLSVLEALGGLIAHGVLGALSPDRRERLLAALETRVFGDDEALASAALDALARDPTGAAERLLFQAAAHPRAALRVQAARALGFVPASSRAFAARVLLEDARDPAFAAALFATLAAIGEAEDIDRALVAIASRPGQVARAASFALHAFAQRGLVDPGRADAICEQARSRDPVVRTNLLLAAHRLDVRCPGLDPRDLLERGESEVVRAAAARILASRGEPGDEAVLARCAAADRSRRVARVCRGESPASEGRAELDVTAYDALGRERFEKRTVAVLFADGSVLVTLTDPRARIRLTDVPAGAFDLVSPSTLRLEP